MRGVTGTFVVVAVLLVGGGCSPAALAPEEIVPAFIAASQDAARTMHMEWRGTVATSETGFPGGAGTANINGVFEFNGPDYEGILTADSGGFGAGNQSYARVGGVAFVNFSDSGWQRADVIGVAPQELDPLHGLTVADVAYEDVQELNGAQVHRLRVSDPMAAVRGFFGGLAPFGSPALNENGASEYLVYVDAMGIPVAAHVVVELTMQVNMGGEFSSIDYSIRWDYAFSLWGEPVTIRAPSVVGGGGIDDFPQPAPR
jgi:hypothetical protein